MSKQRCVGKPGEPRRIPREVPVGPNFRYDWNDCTGCPDCKPEPCVDCGGEGFVLKETSNFAHASGCDGHKCATDCPVEVRDTEPIGCERCQHTGREPEPSETKPFPFYQQSRCDGSLGKSGTCKGCRACAPSGHGESIIECLSAVMQQDWIDAALREAYQRGYRQSEVDDNWDGVNDEGYAEGKDNE